MTPTPTVTIIPAPIVVQPEDTVTLTLPRRSAEVLITVLGFVGGPYGDGEPRTRMNQISFILMKAGVKNAQYDLIVTGSAYPMLGRTSYPVGLRLGWRGGQPLIPHPDLTGGIIKTISNDKTLRLLQAAPGRATLESKATEAKQAAVVGTASMDAGANFNFEPHFKG